jgi:hypothetical protein
VPQNSIRKKLKLIIQLKVSVLAINAIILLLKKPILQKRVFIGIGKVVKKSHTCAE